MSAKLTMEPVLLVSKQTFGVFPHLMRGECSPKLLRAGDVPTPKAAWILVAEEQQVLDLDQLPQQSAGGIELRIANQKRHTGRQLRGESTQERYSQLTVVAENPSAYMQ